MTTTPQIPNAEHRAELDAALHVTGADTSFWDHHGRPAPWPDDIDEWRPTTFTPEPGDRPF
jgi:hypothetical protein